MRIRVRISDSPPSIRVSIFSYKLDKFFVSWESSQEESSQFCSELFLLRTANSQLRTLCRDGAIGRRADFKHQMMRVQVSLPAPKQFAVDSSRFAVKTVRSIITVNFFAANCELSHCELFCGCGATGRRAGLRNQMLKVQLLPAVPKCGS